jgi:hypothetical protein
VRRYATATIESHAITTDVTWKKTASEPDWRFFLASKSMAGVGIVERERLPRSFLLKRARSGRSPYVRFWASLASCVERNEQDTFIVDRELQWPPKRGEARRAGQTSPRISDMARAIRRRNFPHPGCGLFDSMERHA